MCEIWSITSERINSVTPACSLLCLWLFCNDVASAQLLVNTVAGGTIRSGVPAQDVTVGTMGGITRDASAGIVFSERSRHIIRRIRTDGTIETIAGTGVSGYGGDGGPATSALLNNPTGLQYDVAGNLYLIDTVNYRIRRIDTAGIITTVAGTGIPGSLGSGDSAIATQIGLSNSLSIDNQGNLYFSETYFSAAAPSGAWGRIRRLTSSGRLEIVAGVDPSTCSPCTAGDRGPATVASILAGPLAFDSAGNLYVADGNRIRRITPDGVIDKFAGYGAAYGDGGPALNAVFGTVQSLTVDPSGAIYFAAGIPSLGIALLIERIATDGAISTVAGGGRSGDGPASQTLLNSINGLVGDGSGNVYFADSNRIRVVTAQSTVQTVAGGAVKPAPDGTAATDAWLANPTAITVSRSGELYMFEQSTCSIRKVGSDGRLSAVAGTGRCGTLAPSGPATSTDLPLTSHLVIDSQNRLYGAAGLFVYTIGPDGTVAQVTGTVGTSSPLIAIDSKDRLYVASTFGPGITRIAPGAAPESFSSLLFGFSNYAVATIGTDPHDNVYVIGHNNTGQNPVVRFDQTGHPSQLGTAFGDSTLSPSPFISIAGDAEGNAWFTDGLRINKYTATTQEAVSQFQGFSGDGGPMVAAYFYNPSRLAFAPSGDLYVLDQSNNRVRRIRGSPPKNPPLISQGGIVNAASLTGGAIAPGELISIFGSNFGLAAPQTSIAQNNSLPRVLGSTRVFFNSSVGAIIAATADQINVFVPYSVAGTPSISVFVDVDGIRSAPITVPIAASAIGLSSADSSGTGQGAILNQDSSYNGRNNPASPGSVISLFGTGEGITSPALPDGALVLSTPVPAPIASPIMVSIGGQPAEILYAGSAPSLPVGAFQLNVRVPVSIAPGDAAVSATVGSSSTVRRITCAVQ
jgi:uncharacterized protein (TIGR03437 family)